MLLNLHYQFVMALKSSCFSGLCCSISQRWVETLNL
uniref:Uncharacterized protein n=1 Tax=Rhizophora mucronata TaxID=61149 RepID=A0A2P2R4R7_RHIMU